MAKTSMNMEENIASMLCYIGAWITGIIFIAVEKENKTVRFHAWQSFMTFLPLMIVAVVIGWIGSPKWSGGWYYGRYDPGIPALVWLSWIIWLITVVLWVLLIVMAYQGQKFKIPIIGDIAEKQA
jgi:uncharacterized membrane protein